MLYFIFGILLLFLILGFPVFLAIGFSTLIRYFIEGPRAMTTLVFQAFSGVNSYTFIAIPMFMFAGNIMNKTGITKNLLNFASIFVGFITGGLALVNVLGSILFAGISGSALADTAAIGSVMIPAMEEAGYEKGYAGAVTAASAIIGPVIAPSIVLVIYGAAFGVSIGGLFAAALVPGLTMGITQLIITYMIARKKGYPSEERVSFKEATQRTRKALLPLGMPVIIIGGIFTGKFTATEASVIAVLFGLFVGIIIYNNLSLKDIMNEALSSVFTAAGILIIIAAASQLSFVFARERIPQTFLAIIMDITGNKIILLLLINAILIFAGMFISRTVNLFLLGPILIPALSSLGLGDYHIAMIIVFGLGIGHITPPVGSALYTTAFVGDIEVDEIVRFVIPYLIGLIILTLIITFWPPIVEFLPARLGF